MKLLDRYRHKHSSGEFILDAHAGGKGHTHSQTDGFLDRLDRGISTSMFMGVCRRAKVSITLWR